MFSSKKIRAPKYCFAFNVKNSIHYSWMNPEALNSFLTSVVGNSSHLFIIAGKKIPLNFLHFFNSKLFKQFYDLNTKTKKNKWVLESQADTIVISLGSKAQKNSRTFWFMTTQKNTIIFHCWELKQLKLWKVKKLAKKKLFFRKN